MNLRDGKICLVVMTNYGFIEHSFQLLADNFDSMVELFGDFLVVTGDFDINNVTKSRDFQTMTDGNHDDMLDAFWKVGGGGANIEKVLHQLAVMPDAQECKTVVMFSNFVSPPLFDSKTVDWLAERNLLVVTAEDALQHLDVHNYLPRRIVESGRFKTIRDFQFTFMLLSQELEF